MFASVQMVLAVWCHVSGAVYVRHTWYLDAGIDGSHSIIGKLYMIG